MQPMTVHDVQETYTKAGLDQRLDKQTEEILQNVTEKLPPILLDDFEAVLNRSFSLEDISSSVTSAAEKRFQHLDSQNGQIVELIEQINIHIQRLHSRASINASRVEKIENLVKGLKEEQAQLNKPSQTWPDVAMRIVELTYDKFLVGVCWKYLFPTTLMISSVIGAVLLISSILRYAEMIK